MRRHIVFTYLDSFAAAKKRAAFSLVELSIVLVVLGLLTGGILAGQALIRAAELRSVATDYDRFLSATRAFATMYKAIPGDFSTATAVWGYSSTASNCTNNTSAASSAAGVCDGDDNGALGPAPLVAGASGQGHQFWRHLSKAGFIEGDYTGVQDSAGSSMSVLGGVNAPSSRITNGTWAANSTDPVTANAFTIPGGYGNHFLIGQQNSGGNLPLPALLRPKEAWNIDTKLDDGRPAYGKVIARDFSTCSTPVTGAATTTNLDSAYNLTNTAQVCSLYFIKQF